MRLGLYTESVRDLPFEAALDLARELEIGMLEIATGGQSKAPHLDLARSLGDADARARWCAAIEERGLLLESLNCSAFPLHPRLGAAHAQLTRDTIRLAELLGIDTIISQSGCPGDSETSRMPNWIVSRWPDENVEVLEWQWERTIALWRELAAFAGDHGVRRICLELHPMNMVYNVPTFVRLRDAVGPIIAVNFDPSHLIWQGMDVFACLRALGDSVSHVHLKDTRMEPKALALAGVLDTTAPRALDERPWAFSTLGDGHDASWWRTLLATLREIGFDGVLSTEHADARHSRVEGLRRSVAFIRPLL